jgi:hypothetical protein
MSRGSYYRAGASSKESSNLSPSPATIRSRQHVTEVARNELRKLLEVDPVNTGTSSDKDDKGR